MIINIFCQAEAHLLLGLLHVFVIAADYFNAEIRFQIRNFPYFLEGESRYIL